MELSCNVTSTPTSGFIYNMNQNVLSHVSWSGCAFSWSNGSTVIANNEDKHQLVMRNDLATLETSECFPNIGWEAHCTSNTTGFLTDFVSYCNTSCSKLDFVYGDKDGRLAIWIAAVVIIFLVLIGLIIICKCRNKSNRDGCTPCGGRYTVVKVETPGPKPPDV